jgi:nitrogen fixation protein
MRTATFDGPVNKKDLAEQIVAVENSESMFE